MFLNCGFNDYFTHDTVAGAAGAIVVVFTGWSVAMLQWIVGLNGAHFKDNNFDSNCP